MTTSPQAILDSLGPPPSAAGAPVEEAARLPRRIAGALMHPGLAAIVDQGVVSGTNFITALVIAHQCSRQDMGVYYLAWTIVLFLTAVTCNLVSVPYTMYCNRHRGSAGAWYAGSTLVHQLLLSGLAAAGLLAVAAALEWGAGPPSLRPLAWTLAAVLPPLLMREFIRRWAFAHFALRTAVVVDLATSGLQLSGLFLLVFCFHGISIPAVYLVMGGASAAVCAAWFAWARPPLRMGASRIAADWRAHWGFGKWALAGQLANLGFYLLPWMLAAVHGKAATGVLAACNTLVGLANLFVIGMGNFVGPKAAHALAEGGARALAGVMRTTLLLFVVVLGAFCAVTWLAGDLMAWCLGSQYAGCGPLIAVLAMATFTDAVGLTACSGLWALDRPAANFAGDLVQLAVMIAFALALVTPLGAMGIAISLVAGRAAGAALRWFVLRMSLADDRSPAAFQTAS